MKVAVIVVTYNSGDHLKGCLDACQRHGLFESADVLVVDNASTDDTRDVARKYGLVQLLANGTNRGFAAAVNQGIEATGAEFCLLLNPDAQITTSIQSMVEACQEQDVAACGGRLLGPSGETQVGFQVRRFPTVGTFTAELLGINRLWPGNPLNQHYRYLDGNPEEPADVEQPAGAFLMIRRSVWEELGGFDESFHPLWFEDVDYLRRATLAGYRVRYVPDSIALHRGGHSIESLDGGLRKIYWYGSLIKYVGRHFRPPGRWVVDGAVLLGVALRAVTEIVQQRSFRPVSVWSKVFQFSVSCLSKSDRVSVVSVRSEAALSHATRQALESDRERIRRSA